MFPIIINAQNNRNYLYKAVYDGDIEYIKKYLELYDGQLSLTNTLFSNNDFRLLRNTIYAMHGYKFKTKDLQEHFQKFAWYKGTKDNVDNELNENEKRLIRIILATEAANPPTRKDLIGKWVMAVPASVESIGFLYFDIKSDGVIEEYNLKGRWYLEGTTFRIILDDNKLTFLLDNGSIEIENFRIFFMEYKGKLYKFCEFFGYNMPELYEYAIPLEYFYNY